MVGRFLFNNRDGRTPLELDFKKDLKAKYAHIQFASELDEIEEESIIDGLIWLDSQTADPKDCLFWEKLHRNLFKKIWSWAGKIRQHELNNDEFNHPGYIQQNIKKLEGDLKFWLSLAEKMDTKEAMARFHEGFLTIHPFSNGNGRTCRILTEHICQYEKIQIPTWGHSLKHDPQIHRNSYIDAVMKARHHQDFSHLIRFMFN